MPIPWSIETVFPLLTVQENVTLPTLTAPDETVKLEMVGAGTTVTVADAVAIKPVDPVAVNV
jgi:hypothetical protein